MTAPAPPDVAEIEAIVRLYRQYGDQLNDLAVRRAELRSRFEALVPVGFVAEVDGKAVSKSAPARSFDLEAALAVARLAGIEVRQVLTPDVADLRDRLKAIGKLDEAMLPGKGAPRTVLG